MQILGIALACGLSVGIAGYGLLSMKEIAAALKLRHAVERFGLTVSKAQALAAVTSQPVVLTVSEFGWKMEPQLVGGSSISVHPVRISTPTGKLYFYASGVTSPTTVVFSDREATCIFSLSLRGRLRKTCT